MGENLAGVHHFREDVTMRGLEEAAGAVASVLTLRLPAALTALEARLDLEPGSVERPQLVSPHDLGRIPLESWPAVLVVGQQLEDLRRLDVDVLGTVYLVRYRLRVYALARGDDEASTDLARKRLTLAAREVLLGYQALRDAGGSVDERSLRESYSDVEREPDGATVAGAYLELVVALEERLDAVGGTAGSGVDVTARLLNL
jgi:hypothetical protein